MSIVIRQAHINDVQGIIPFIKQASGGITDFLLKDIIKGMSPDELIEMALLDDSTTFYIDNILVAEKEGEIIAAVNYYQSQEHGIPNVMKALIPDEKLTLITPYLETSVENSMYIHTLAVDTNHCHSALGFDLCRQVGLAAKLKGKSCLSAHVFYGNTYVYDALLTAGFKVVKEIEMPRSPLLYHQTNMALMQGPDIS
jgi:hypothetical protein